MPAKTVGRCALPPEKPLDLGFDRADASDQFIRTRKLRPSSMAEPDERNSANLQETPFLERGLGKPGDSGAQNRGKLRTLTEETFRSLYFEQGKTLQQIADLFGVSRVAVHKWARGNLPPSSQLRRVSKESKYQLNETFFDTWTPEMAYVLGVLATDGNVRRYCVNLTSTDLELVEKVRRLIGSNLEITEIPIRGWSRKPQYKLSVSSLSFASALTAIGVTAHKSLTLVFPKMPEECVRHFLRGCWDGDGSFYFEKGRNALRASFVSGSKAFIEGIVQALSQAGFRQRLRWKYRGHRYVRDSDRVKVYISYRGKNPSYSIRLGGPNAIAFGGFIYDSVPESMYLRRKYDIFRSAVTQDTLSKVIPGEPSGGIPPQNE
jgi:transcriptional regulator with XRE-family HTH domain